MLDMAVAKIDLHFGHRLAKRIGGVRRSGIVAGSDQCGERRQARAVFGRLRRQLLVVERDQQDAVIPNAHRRDDCLERGSSGQIVLRPPDQIGRTGRGDMAGDAALRPT